MIPRFGHPPERTRHYKLRPGAYAILPRDGRVLLTRQEEPEPEVQLPGGGIDPGESPLQALHREVFEETGWHIASPRRLGAFRRFVFMPEYDLWAEKLCTLYVAHPVRPWGPPTEPGHIAFFCPQADVLDILGNPGDRAMFAGFLGRSSGARLR